MEQEVENVRRQEERTANVDEPSARQKAYIAALARAAGLRIDVSTVEDMKTATSIIDSLKLLNRRMNGESTDIRDKRVAFGMATKLVFVTHAARQKDISKWSRQRFWDEVRNFYSDYMQQQELAVVGSRME